MQHLYTRYSETYSSLRNVFARLRQSVLANSLRTVILLFVLALSCGAWGETIYFTNVALKDGKMVQGMSNAKTQFITQKTNGFEAINNLTISSTPAPASIYYNDADLTNLSVKDKWGSSSTANKYMRGFKWANSTEYTLSLGTNIASSIIFYGWCGGKKKTLTIGNKSQISAANKQTFEVYNFTDNFTGDIKLKGDGDFYGIIAINLSSCTAPTITTQPVSDTYSVGATPTPLQVAATGEGTLTYQWQSSTDNTTFADITGETSATYTPPTDKAGTTYYRCIVSSGSCSETSAPATITIAANKIIYLNTGVWNTANPVFVAHSYAGSATADIVMEKCADDCSGSIYKAEVPASHTNVIFLREKTGTADDWWNCNNLWNRTAELTIPENNDLFTITDWNNGGTYTCDGNSHNCSNGTWGTYVQSYSVSFNMNGHGNAVSDQCVQSGAAITQPAAPTATGYTFAGWYADAACTQAWDFSTPVTAATTLYAKWTENLTSPVSIKGAWDGWTVHPLEKKPGETGDVAYYTVHLTAGTYEFTPFCGDVHYKIHIPEGAAHAEPMTRARANGTEWYLYKDGQENCSIVADYAGNYTFRIDYTPTNENGRYGVTVTYPALHTITYQEGRPAEYGSLTTFGIPTSTTQVVDGGALTLPDYTTIKIAAGSTTVYKFAGWSDGKTTYPAYQTTIDNLTSDLTLTATWQPVSFNIYYWDGQNEDNSQNKAITGLTPTTYTYASNDPLPTDAAAITNAAGKQGVVFKNWKVRDWDQTTFTLKDLDYTTPYHRYGDINLYAEWDTFCGEMMRATITGESSATLTGNYAGSAEVKVAKGNATDGYKLGKDGYFVKLTLKNATFQAGDYVVVNVITPSAYLELYADKGNTLWCKKTGVTTGENILPLPAEAIGKNTVYLYRTSKSAANMNPFITYMSIVRPCCTAPAFTWENEPTNSRVQDEDFELSTTSNSGGAVIYQSNNTNVATIVDGNKLHFVGEGTVTITAVLAANGDYCDATLSTTIDVVDQCGASSVIYNLPAGTNAKALTTAESVTATEGLTANRAITAVGITLGTSGKELTDGNNNKENLTVSIPNTSQLDKTKYLSFEYTVADGKCFMPCDIQLKVQPISNACYFLIEMTDGNNTLSETTTSLKNSVVNDIRVNNPGNISFCRTVTLKIYSYGATTGYRLGTPIRILGTLDNSVTATIVPDGGTIPNAAALGWILQSDGTYTKQIPQGANLTMPDITRDGYTLTVYHDHNSDTYHPGNTFPLNANYTFTAQWRAVTPDGNVTAIVNPNGGVLTDATGWDPQLDGTFIQTVKKGSTLTLPEVTKTGYRFLYYTDETNDDYYPTSPFPLNADYVFTAQWCQHNTKLKWNVESWKFDDNGTAPKLTTTNLPDGALIQYVSSNTAVATISDDGSTITPFMGGQTTITAIYDGDGDYCPAEASYTLTVECNDPTPQIVGEGILTGCNNSIKLRVKQALETGLTDYPATGYSFQWYKDGQPIANATADTYTAQTVGEYFVVVHGDCYSQSNTAKITSNAAATPEVVTLTRFQYYRPGHTYTDNADTRHLFAYKSAGEDSKACEIKTVIKHAAKTAEKPDAEITDMSFLQTTGTPDENGRYTVTASLNAISTDIDNLLTAGDTIVVTLTPYDNCGTLATAYAQSLNIYITNKPALAFIISGADSYTRDNKKHKLHGDFLTGINKADLCKQSGSAWAESDKGTELPLYTALKKEFEVVPVNGYAAFNLLNYEPFDIVMLTDFPKTDAINKNTHPAYGVLDSLAYIVDYRPMFSLKGHMAKKELTTWGTKGFIADPATPTINPQTDMTVLCYAHGIFAHLPEKANGTATTKKDSLENIIRDENNNIIVRITDGGGYNKKKALQGFTAVDANNFVNIAIIPEGKSGGSLVACCERQTNINARFLLLSVNADATSKITPIGEQAIIKGLHYLLETNAANVSDCSVTFHNGGDMQNPGNGDHLWTTPTNWSTGRLPLKEQNIRIIANCIVNTTDASVANILIKDGNTLTINSNAALKTTGKIKQLNTDNTTSPLTNTNVITIKADASHTGALIHTTTEDETLAATVQLYSKAYLVVTADGKKEKYWQYIGIPIKEAPIPENFFGAYTYIYSEQKGGRGWTRQFDGSSLHGDFSGYATSQTQAETFVLKGDLAATTDRRIRLTYTADGGQGSNLIGNSWTAPIRIDQLQTSDFNGADATIYIYNTGRDDVKDNPSYIEGPTTAGQWMSIPINMVNTAEWKGLKVIPAMQAFQVNTGEETDLVLNYNRLVRSSTTTDINTPLRAPKRTDDALSVMRVRVSDSRTYTDLYLAQHPFFTDYFDNGWDAAFVEGDGRSASLYAITPLGEMAVAAQPQTDGTVLGFTPRRETEYTFSFGYTGEMLYLNDTKQKRSTLITDWNTYTFTANEDDDVNRFYISSTPIDVQTPTGLTNITTMDGILRINNPAHENLSIGIYDAAGRLCALSHTAEAMADIILPATQGVYLVHINGENTQIVHKVTR